MEMAMRTGFMAGVAAAAVVLGGGLAMAQAVLEIAPEQRTRIKEYVVQEHVRPAPLRERIAVGAVLPTDVELAAVPETWGPSLRPYRYVYWDNHVVLVEPSSRKVVEIIE
jgi:hypothetical protein